MREYTDADARRLLRRLGSFWHAIFGDQAGLLALFRAKAVQAEQLYWDYLEAAACAVFDDIPVYHRQHWRLLAFTESELTQAPLRYGEQGVDFGGGYRYGRSASQALYLKLPAGARDVAFLHDNPLAPRVTYALGVDYAIEQDTLRFYVNPFEDARLTPGTLTRGGQAVDRGLTLWGEHWREDRRYLLSHLGAALKLYLPSSESAKRSLTALARLYTAFPNRAALTAFLAALVDAPACLEDEETVEVVLEGERRQIVTDRHVYEAARDADILVAPGQKLRRGDMLTDAVRFLELAYELPGPEDLPALVGGPTLLLGPYRSELSFPNQPGAPWRENGHWRFPVLGEPDDVREFWARVDREGGLALVGGPVSPARELMSCLRGHGIFIRLNARAYGPLAAPRLFMEFARRALAPHLLILSYVELAAPEERVRFVEPRNEVGIINLRETAEPQRLRSRDAVTLVQTALC